MEDFLVLCERATLARETARQVHADSVATRLESQATRAETRALRAQFLTLFRLRRTALAERRAAS